MIENPPQGKPTGKCRLLESIVEYNTPPQAGLGDNLVRSESIVVTNTP